jgi:hypothetical protein
LQKGYNNHTESEEKKEADPMMSSRNQKISNEQHAEDLDNLMDENAFKMGSKDDAEN